jgi:hypothetical protein
MAKTQLPKMDLVFIDGGHSTETVATDWENVKDLLHEKSIVFFDDYPNWGVVLLLMVLIQNFRMFRLWKLRMCSRPEVDSVGKQKTSAWLFSLRKFRIASNYFLIWIGKNDGSIFGFA